VWPPCRPGGNHQTDESVATIGSRGGSRHYRPLLKLRDRIISTPTGVKLALMAAAILVACAVPVGAYLAGASIDSDDESAGQRPPAERPLVLRSSDVDRYEKGSPERVMLEWWRDLQYANTPEALKYYDPRLGISAKSLRKTVQRAARAGLKLSLYHPLIEDTDIGSTEATVYTFLKFETESPAGETETNYNPRAFLLRRVSGEWRVANNSFIERAAKGKPVQ
jgi:hypothetical protein